LLGDLLLAQREAAAALKEYELSLKHTPMRLRGLYGAAKTAEAIGDRKRADEYFGILARMTRNADGDRDEIREVKQHATTSLTSRP
jgi:hypothetical protein